MDARRKEMQDVVETVCYGVRGGDSESGLWDHAMTPGATTPGATLLRGCDRHPSGLQGLFIEWGSDLHSAPPALV